MPLEGKRAGEWLYELSMRAGRPLQPLNNRLMTVNCARKTLHLTGNLIIEHHDNHYNQRGRSGLTGYRINFKL